MASNYPGSLDSFDTIASDKKTSDAVGGRTHRQMHNDLGDAIESVQTELGTTPSGSYATVKARFEAIEGSTLPQVDAKGDLIVGTADNTYDNLGVGTNDTVLLAASGETKGVKWAQVPTAAIQDGAVTPAKMQRQPGNLLTENQASGTDAEGATTGFDTGGSGAVLATTTAQAKQGSRSLQVTASGVGNGTFFTGVAGAAAGAVPVTPGATYTAAASLRSAATAASYGVSIAWLDSGGSYLSSSGATSGTTSTSAWTDVTNTAVAPANAAYAAVGVAMTADASSVHYADAIGLWKGAGGQWSMPGVPIVGGSHIATNGAVHLSGTGTPEGVVTAAPGSTWLQTDATTDVKGWLRWIKASGTGNTGWVAGPEADTGWRSFSGSLLNGWGFYAASRLVIRRVGESVTVHVGDLNHTSATAGQIWTVPSGFRPKWHLSFPNYASGDASSDTAIRLLTSGELDYMGTRASIENASITFLTKDAWPTSLFGSAA